MSVVNEFAGLIFTIGDGGQGDFKDGVIAKRKRHRYCYRCRFVGFRGLLIRRARLELSMVAEHGWFF